MTSGRRGHTKNGAHHPKNRTMYQSAGLARHYSASQHEEPIDPSALNSVRDVARGYRTVVDHSTGYVLIVDLDTLPRAIFDAKGKPVGIAKDTDPTLAEEHEEAERMVEVWAKRAMELNRRIQAGEV